MSVAPMAPAAIYKYQSSKLTIGRKLFAHKSHSLGKPENGPIGILLTGLAGPLPMSNLAPVLVGGEALLDFISTEIGSGLGGSRTFEKWPGGSPFNIAVGVQRLGVPVAFV